MSARTLGLTVSPEQDGRRVRSLLQGPLGLSAGLVTRLKQRPGAVRLNGQAVRTLDVAHAGDRLEVDVGDTREGVFVPGGPALDILYEDEDLLIINKPAGIAVHGRSERGEPTIGAAVARYLGSAAPFHPVNRLDRGTTGAMCAASGLCGRLTSWSAASTAFLAGLSSSQTALCAGISTVRPSYSTQRDSDARLTASAATSSCAAMPNASRPCATSRVTVTTSGPAALSRIEPVRSAAEPVRRSIASRNASTNSPSSRPHG